MYLYHEYNMDNGSQRYIGRDADQVYGISHQKYILQLCVYNCLNWFDSWGNTLADDLLDGLSCSTDKSY